MESSSKVPVGVVAEPDLHPLCPTPGQIALLLSDHSGLVLEQKSELVAHCLSRACAFGDLNLLSYLLVDTHVKPYVDLNVKDEDGLGLVSQAIHGFGADSDRDIEREECIRLLVTQGADVGPDKAGWTPLHHAALLCPPSLISYLLTHGCSIFAVTRRNLTPLDIVTAHSVLPGREDVALLLEETMRSEGWTSGKMEDKRKSFEEHSKKQSKRRVVRDGVQKVLGVSPKWWGNTDEDALIGSDSEDEDGEEMERIFTPPADYASMLVFSPHLLPQIFDSLILNFKPELCNSQPANTLYMLARFACLTCDHTWLEDLIIGATDAIEDAFFSRADDITTLIFWLYNTTIWLHLMQCDSSINEACEMLGSFELLEEVINSVFVFLIRFTERKIDQLLDSTILDYSPPKSEVETVQFESQWSIIRSFTKKKPNASPTPSHQTLRNGTPSSPTRPISPTLHPGSFTTSSSRSSSTMRMRQSNSASALQTLFAEAPTTPSPVDLVSFLTAIHTLLILSEINPVFITQLWSQVIYWTSCEIFNRIINRKKYLCRSRAAQISINLTVLEDWLLDVEIPPGVQTHLAPVRDLLTWIQRLSSLSEFSDLVETIQSIKNINPLQMRRAVRDYKYEIHEPRMTEECVQYLTQLQKDWERHRVKVGVEALRKEIGDRDRDRDSIMSTGDAPSLKERRSSFSGSTLSSMGRQNIDILFDRTQDPSAWEPIRPPQVLGELLDSRYMLPLLFPSDPRLLSALPPKSVLTGYERNDKSISSSMSAETRSVSGSSTSSQGTPLWRAKNKKIRRVGVEVLQTVDGARPRKRWASSAFDEDGEGDAVEIKHTSYSSSDERDEGEAHITQLTRKPSGRGKSRPSLGEADPQPQEKH